MKSFICITLIILGSVAAQAYENRCHDKFEGPVKSLCKGRTIPSSKTRNFHRGNHELVCTSEADHYFRMPQRFNFNAWSDLLKVNQEDKAQELRKKQPDIKWSGVIPYSTVEVWSWESCELVTDGYECGYETKSREVERSRQVCTGTGEATRCSTEYYTETEYYEEPKTCYADVRQTEEWNCSTEKMTFNAKFNRPDYSEWNTKNPKYIDAIPNKYDLLPGEVEDVQIFTNGGSYSTINPVADVGDAWNKYSFAITGSGQGAACRQNQDLHIDVAVNTIERNAGKKTPNAFKLPTDHEGNAVSPFLWKDAKTESGEYVSNGTPLKMILSDSSSGMINALSEQSRKTAQREQAKQNQGAGKTPDAMNEDSESKAGFFKNTKVRVRLVKENNTLWDTSSTENVIYDQSDGIVPSLNAYSKNQDIANADVWEIDLRKNGGPGVYETRWMGRDRALKPGQKYYMEVSVYQKGVKGLYLQDCEEDYSFFACRFRWLGLGRTDSNIFSDPLNVRFETNAEMIDERGMFDQFMDFIK